MITVVRGFGLYPAGKGEVCRWAKLVLRSDEVVISLFTGGLFVARADWNLVFVSHLELKELDFTD